MTVLDLTIALARASRDDGRAEPNWQVARCGAGGQTVSYRAAAGDTVVCVKTAPPGSPHLQREAQMLRLISSPHVPRLLVDGADEGFVVEEYVEGRSLATMERMAMLAALPGIAAGIASATAAFTAASPSFIHRDIKPANLVLAGNRLVVLDFGSAEFEGCRAPGKAVGPRAKLGRGTHLAQPLEQLLGLHTQDRRVDVFAAAAVTYWILTGRPPYSNSWRDPDAAALGYAAAERRLEVGVIDCPSAVRVELLRALCIDPERRTLSLQPLADAIRSSEDWIPCSEPR